ncbi:hypothetical protein L195_g001116 [Trifolium pratense]|uniref:Uncharacterized protein n=1 Tax=Trifolium pratense TaxID=57577 RepID=A0A2K3NNU7_TRIPR|nr:hypothetical protein L195_g001116 [Trifolium pratense]
MGKTLRFREVQRGSKHEVLCKKLEVVWCGAFKVRVNLSCCGKDSKKPSEESSVQGGGPRGGRKGAGSLEFLHLQKEEDQLRWSAVASSYDFGDQRPVVVLGKVGDFGEFESDGSKYCHRWDTVEIQNVHVVVETNGILRISLKDL